MLNVALLGAGRIAGVHVSAITTNPGSRLVAVSDINTDAAAKLAAQYGDGMAALAMAVAATRSAKTGLPVALASVPG